MRLIFFFFLFYFFFTGKGFATVFYVSGTGSDSNPGTLAQPWKTVTYASANSNPGDTIYVKAGIYNENVVISKSGNAAKPIVFLGYQVNPGDAPPVLVKKSDPYSAFASADMPTFDGGDRSKGIGVNCRYQKYIVVKNFQIQNYSYGFIAGGTSPDAGRNYFFNINVMNIGNIQASYSGLGIALGSMGTLFSNNNKIDSCLVVNSAAEGISINGDSNRVTGSKVYCNQNTSAAATDYYMIVTGSYNYFRDCYIERALGLSHWGHGYTAKTNAAQVIDQGLNLPSIPAQYNQFYYCVARNMNEAFCVRHRMAQYNLFYHCKAIGSHTGATGSSGGEGNGIVIRDGASDNIFDGCIAENCYQAIVLVDSNEDGDMGTNPPGHPNKNNKIINAVVYNSYIGISFSDSGVPSDAGENTIAGCTFYNTRYMFYAGRSCKNMKYRNNIYQGTLPATPGGAFKVGSFANDIVSNGATTGFSNCNFYNIQGGMPTGFVSGAENSISADPLFKNSAANDFHLLSGSPCINSGITLDFLKTDFDSISRPQGVAHDMGAYEFQIITSIPNTQPEKLFIRIYPNPASGILHIQTKEPGCKISIYDMAGNLIHQVTSQLNSTEIGLGKVASGMYILRAQNKRKKESEKFIVIK